MKLLHGATSAQQNGSEAVDSRRRSKALVLRTIRQKTAVAVSRFKRGWKPLMGDVTVLCTVLDADMKARLLSTTTTEQRQGLLEAALEDREINAGW